MPHATSKLLSADEKPEAFQIQASLNQHLHLLLQYELSPWLRFRGYRWRTTYRQTSLSQYSMWSQLPYLFCQGTMQLRPLRSFLRQVGAPDFHFPPPVLQVVARLAPLYFPSLRHHH